MSALILLVPRASSTRPKQTSNYTFETNRVLHKHLPCCDRSHTLFAWVTRSLCVCLRMRGRPGCDACAALCQHLLCFTTLTLKYDSLLVTLYFHLWSPGVSPPPCHLWAEHGSPSSTYQFCHREASSGANSLQRDRGWRGGCCKGMRQTDNIPLQYPSAPSSEGKGKGEEMRGLASFVVYPFSSSHCWRHACTCCAVSANTPAAADWKLQFTTGLWELMRTA